MDNNGNVNLAAYNALVVSYNELKMSLAEQSNIIDKQKKLLNDQGRLIADSSEQLLAFSSSVTAFSSLVRYLRHIINKNNVQLDTAAAVKIYEDALDGREFFPPATDITDDNGDEDDRQIYNFSVNFDAFDGDEDNERPMDISSWNGFDRKWIMRDRNN